MRIANLNDSAALITPEGAVDIYTASNGAFGPRPDDVFADWAAFRAWAGSAALPPPRPCARHDLGSPSPRPRQVFAIGLNYSAHAAESGYARPGALPPVFTKFPSCVTGPDGDIVLPAGGNTDWEVELVVVIGAEARDVTAADAWDHVAGLSCGQDISERVLQMAATPPQFGLGKSYPGFGPVGPWLVTPDEFADPDDLELSCAINGEQMQKGRTRDLIFSVPDLIEQLSRVTPLLPGDLIFTGTPAGVGLGRTPQRWLADGDVLTTSIEGIGEMRHRFVAAPQA